MNDDTLLKAVAKMARDEAKRDESATTRRLASLAANELSERERDELRRLASDDEDFARALALHEPLDVRFLDRVADQVTQGHNSVAPLYSRSSRQSASTPSRRGPVLAAAIVAAAAAIASLVYLPLVGEHRPVIPEYELTVSGQVKQLRTGSKETPTQRKRAVFNTESILSLIARPSKNPDRELVANVFADTADGLQRLDLPLTVSPKGAVQLRVNVGRTPNLPRGDTTLHLVIAPPDRFPSTAQIERDLMAKGNPDTLPYRLVSAEVRIEAPQ